MTEADINQIAEAVAEKVKEDMGLRDIIIGAAIGEGGIPIHGRENRKEPCRCCKTDDKLMCSSSDVIGLLSQKEIKEWCSEIIEVPDGRCERARKIKEAARECKEKHPHNTTGFFECYAPAFSKITRGSNPGITPVTPEVTMSRADLEKLQQAIATWEKELAKYPTSIQARDALLKLRKEEAGIKAQLAIPKAEAGMPSNPGKEPWEIAEERKVEKHIERIPQSWWSVPPGKKKKMTIVNFASPTELEIVGEDALNFFRTHRKGETQRYYWTFREFDGAKNLWVEEL